MFYLRKVNKETRMCSNSTIGENYSTIHKDLHQKEFEECLQKMDWIGKEKLKNIYKFVSDSKGKLIPLNCNNEYYVVTENGNTYEKL